MNVYWSKRGGHIHMRVFLDGALMGKLVCRDYEFSAVRSIYFSDMVNIQEEDAG